MIKNKIFILTFFLLFLTFPSLAGDNKEEFSDLTSAPLNLSAYTQVRYTHWQEGTDGFSIKRARVGLKGEILKDLHYKLQIDTVKSPILLDAQVEIKLNSHLKISLGQFKVPFSLENLTSSSALDMINRCQTVEKLCPGRDIGAKGRDIGITINGEFSSIEYALGIFNGSGINNKDFNEQKDIAGRLVFHPVRFLTLGLSHYKGKYSSAPGDPAVKRDRTGAEVLFVQNQLSIKGEYISAKDDQTERNGWYLQGGYFLTPKKIQATVRYDSLDKDKAVQRDQIGILTLGLNWFFSERTKFQINYEHHGKESGEPSKNVILAQLQAGF